MPIAANYVYRDPTQQELVERFQYNEKTGEFFYKPGACKRLGERMAGTMVLSGRWMLPAGKRQHQANRCAWIYMHGAIPEGMEVGYKVIMDLKDKRTIGNWANRAENLVLMTREEFHKETMHRIAAAAKENNRKPGRKCGDDRSFTPSMNLFDQLLAAKRNPAQ